MTEKTDTVADPNKKNDEPADPNAPTADAELAGVQADFENLQTELMRFRDLALRSQADFDNYRKRAAREKEDAIKYANASLLERFIPVVDNFELGLEAARTHAKESSVLAGMGMVQKQLTDFMTDSGVEIIDATGKEFDPALHEAIGQEHSADVTEGHVVRTLRKGYKLKDRLLRPANVIVSKGRASK